MPGKTKPTTVKKKWQGLHANRYKREPLEKKFALAFQEFCEAASATRSRPDHLDYLLSESNTSPDLVSDRDRQVAATIIQWLGSPVGSQWVKGVLDGQA